MKNKLDWFDDNWNWDVRSTRVLHELLLSPTYRWPRKVNVPISRARNFQGVHVVEALWIYHMNCGSVSSHCCSKLCIPLRGEQQATHENVAKMQRS